MLIHAVLRGSRDLQFDVNYDGRITWDDVMTLVRQLGKACKREAPPPPPTRTPTRTPTKTVAPPTITKTPAGPTATKTSVAPTETPTPAPD